MEPSDFISTTLNLNLEVVVTTCNWANNQTHDLPKWTSVAYPSHKLGGPPTEQ